MNKSLDVSGRTREMDRKSRKRWKDRGRSGFEERMKEKDKIEDSFIKDLDLKKQYGKDAPKSRSFGIDPTVAKDMNLSGNLAETMTETELKEKFPTAGKKAGGGVKKKMMAGGGVKKKMMAKGGATGKKKKTKVRGAGIARKGVRPAKMR